MESQLAAESWIQNPSPDQHLTPRYISTSTFTFIHPGNAWQAYLQPKDGFLGKSCKTQVPELVRKGGEDSPIYKLFVISFIELSIETFNLPRFWDIKLKRLNDVSCWIGGVC